MNYYLLPKEVKEKLSKDFQQITPDMVIAYMAAQSDIIPLLNQKDAEIDKLYADIDILGQQVSKNEVLLRECREFIESAEYVYPAHCIKAGELLTKLKDI